MYLIIVFFTFTGVVLWATVGTSMPSFYETKPLNAILWTAMAVAGLALYKSWEMYPKSFDQMTCLLLLVAQFLFFIVVLTFLIGQTVKLYKR